ncbi:hypothetical protein HYPSUDRAFT_856658 [Hypholoma sublateritium FD-334 SS-4]|uniref:Major facilitator superfamily (MFS) profile domain-containing protein n=1 Tax=Hypholoma sublateritium (strain FD-334 SS-4) TaxID=945553 RepID=A0A0D2NLI1_HYPSF|nr:hypothetical protein HYPSUDRAFT_856658 [Hypholoma sublateritium FD-334 SS-4]
MKRRWLTPDRRLHLRCSGMSRQLSAALLQFEAFFKDTDVDISAPPQFRGWLYHCPSTMDTEATPLLTFNEGDDIYLRFSAREKQNILTIVAACGLLPFFVTGTFTPALPQIAEELDSTGEMVNLSISLSIFAMSFGSLVGATYSTVYGRKAIYLWTLPIFIVGSIGVTFADGIPSLFAWRFLQSMGSSPVGVVGTGIIGDIFRVEERGRAMSVFFAATLIGPSIAPLAGGYAAQYYSWRAMQGALGVTGIITLYFIWVFLPETSHFSADGGKTELKNTKVLRNFISVNPLRPLWLLRSPPFFMIGIILSVCVIGIFAQIIPLTFTIRERYHIYNEAWVGACLLPTGFGNMAGAIMIGPISDRMVIQWRAKRGGVWYPEDRLRAAILPLLIVIPGSILVLGLASKYLEGTLGLVVTLICLFFNGMGVDMTFGPLSAYLVDVIQSSSAESLAANTAFRAVVLSFSIAITLPLVNSIGLLMTNVLCSALTWISCGLLWIIICRGEQLRAWLDVGYSVAPSGDKRVVN